MCIANSSLVQVWWSIDKVKGKSFSGIRCKKDIHQWSSDERQRAYPVTLMMNNGRFLNKKESLQDAKTLEIF